MQELQSAYPVAYAERSAEEYADAENGDSIQAITVYIGNKHTLVPRSVESHNTHEWTFFVRPSRTDIIEEVHIHLHPTFHQSHIVRTRPPYAVQRLGWGVFPMLADIILKAGYSWVSSDAVDSPDGAPKGMLRLEWMLDFTSFDATGAMGRCRLKVKSDRDWNDGETARDRRELERVVRQYERDGLSILEVVDRCTKSFARSNVQQCLSNGKIHQSVSDALEDGQARRWI